MYTCFSARGDVGARVDAGVHACVRVKLFDVSGRAESESSVNLRPRFSLFPLPMGPATPTQAASYLKGVNEFSDLSAGSHPTG